MPKLQPENVRKSPQRKKISKLQPGNVRKSCWRKMGMRWHEIGLGYGKMHPVPKGKKFWRNR